MKKFGNPRIGTLKRILDVIYDNGQGRVYDTDWITSKLIEIGHWKLRSSRTPKRSINAYFSQNPKLFEHCGRNRYRLRPEHHRADEKAKDLKTQFNEQAIQVYENGKRELGYNATRFLQKIRTDGGLAAAKSWLRPKRNDKPTNGFLKLVDYGKLDISLEATVLRPPWDSLFTPDELQVARNRLKKYGYFESPADRSPQFPEELDNDTYREGASELVAINHYERNPAARAACIAHYQPKCYVCGFNFASVYGAVFDGFIHVHHLCSLASIGTEYEVDPIADLRPVCPNCHAIIHRRTPCYTIDEVRQMIKAAKPK